MRPRSAYNPAKGIRVVQSRSKYEERRGPPRYTARLVHGGEAEHLGTFATRAEAEAAYLEAYQRVHKSNPLAAANEGLNDITAA